jgi:hypothetical protein
MSALCHGGESPPNHLWLDRASKIDTGPQWAPDGPKTRVSFPFHNLTRAFQRIQEARLRDQRTPRRLHRLGDNLLLDQANCEA